MNEEPTVVLEFKGRIANLLFWLIKTRLERVLISQPDGETWEWSRDG